MKRILLIIIMFVLLTGCSKNTPSNAVKKYLNNYNNLDAEVLDDMETQVDTQNLSEEQKKTYRDILKKQYKDLSYKITKDETKDNITYVTTKVTVYDLYASLSESSAYLAENMDKFYDENGKYSTEKYIDYKLDKMKDTTNKIEYTIVFTVKKDSDNNYVVDQPSSIDLDKIHGVYEYDLK